MALGSGNFKKLDKVLPGAYTAFGNSPPMATSSRAAPAGPAMSYKQLADKPKINDVELTGNKSFEDLGDERFTNRKLQEILDNTFNE